MEGTSIFLESLQVTLRVIRLTVFPAGEVDANELVGQRTAGLMVPVVMLVLVLSVEAVGPELFTQGASGIFVEGLAPEFGTAVAKVNGLSGAALSDNGSDAVELSHLGGALKAGAISPEGDQEPGSQARSSSWQAAKEVRIRMLVHSFFNLLVELGDHPVERFEHGCQSKHSQAGGQDDRWVCG